LVVGPWMRKKHHRVVGTRTSKMHEELDGRLGKGDATTSGAFHNGVITDKTESQGRGTDLGC